MKIGADHIPLVELTDNVKRCYYLIRIQLSQRGLHMSNGLIIADPARKHTLRRILHYGVLAYNLPVCAYHVLQFRLPQSLLAFLLLLAANVAMFRYGGAIESGRVQRGILLLPYGLLIITLILIGLYGFLQL